jgi:hypothetical protein
MSQSRVIVRAGYSMPPDIRKNPKQSKPTNRDLFSGLRSSTPVSQERPTLIPQDVKTYTPQKIETYTFQGVSADGGRGNSQVAIRAQRYVTERVRSGSAGEGTVRILKWVELGKVQLIIESCEDRGDMYFRLSPDRFVLPAEATSFASFVDYIQVYDDSCPDHRIFIDPRASEEAMREIFFKKYSRPHATAQASVRLVRTPYSKTYLRIQAPEV